MTNPKGWDVKKLGDVCSKITDGTHQPPLFVISGIPFLFVSNIVNNEIDYNTKKFISETTYNQLTKNSPIEIDDILITSAGSYGNPAIVQSSRKFCFQRHISHIKPKHEIVNTSFLFSQLKTDYIKFQIDRRVKGIAQKTLNLSELNKIEIIIPPMNDQAEFSRRLQISQQMREDCGKPLSEYNNLFNSLMQKAFKGELKFKD